MFCLLSVVYCLLNVSQFTDGFKLFSVMDYHVSAAAGKSPDDSFGAFGIFVARAVVEFPAGQRPAGHGPVANWCQ